MSSKRPSISGRQIEDTTNQNTAYPYDFVLRTLDLGTLTPSLLASLTPSLLASLSLFHLLRELDVIIQALGWRGRALGRRGGACLALPL